MFRKAMVSLVLLASCMQGGIGDDVSRADSKIIKPPPVLPENNVTAENCEGINKHGICENGLIAKTCDTKANGGKGKIETIDCEAKGQICKSSNDSVVCQDRTKIPETASEESDLPEECADVSTEGFCDGNVQTRCYLGADDDVLDPTVVIAVECKSSDGFHCAEVNKCGNNDHATCCKNEDDKEEPNDPGSTGGSGSGTGSTTAPADYEDGTTVSKAICDRIGSFKGECHANGLDVNYCDENTIFVLECESGICTTDSDGLPRCAY